MAIITTIREKSGLTIGVVAVSLLLFILGGDLFSNNSYLARWLTGAEFDNTVAVIGGKHVPYEEYQKIEAELEDYYRATGQQLDDDLRQTLRNQAWLQLLFDHAYQPELDKLGITVTSEEWDDMIQGNNIHPMIRSFFTNRETGMFDPNQIENFKQGIAQGQVPPEYLILYRYMIKLVKDARQQQKYEGLLGLGTYVTDAEAKREYLHTTRTADIKFAFIPTYSVSDSAISFTDQDLKDYYQANKDKYIVQANRAIEYLSFPVVASEQDDLETKKKADAIIPSFEEALDDTAFVEVNSDNQEELFMTMSPANAPKDLQFGELELGKVYGPFKEGSRYRVIKVLSSRLDSLNQYARASHILFKTPGSFTDEQKEEVKEKALDLLGKLKDGAPFDKMAMLYGEDGTKSRGGDLGWFNEKTMVEDFSNAIFDASSLGLIPNLIKTQFGYHIIQITGLPTRSVYDAAIVDINIEPGQMTDRKAYREAGRFAVYTTYDDLKAAVELDSGKRILMQALNVGVNAKTINNMEGADVRDIVKWAYDQKRKIGDVSPIYRLDNQYVIASLRSKTDKDEKSFEAVKTDVRKDLVNELKNEVIISKLGDLSGKSIEDVVESYGQDVSVNQQAGVSFNTPSLNRLGRAPNTIGTIYKMKEGETSAPIKESNGIVIVTVNSVTDALKQQSYDTYKADVENKRLSAIQGKIMNALEEEYKAEDLSYKYQ